jgi:drug/metabolite transporter (DMT)-like permease
VATQTLHSYYYMAEKQKAILAVILGNFFFGTSVIAVKHISPSLIPPIALTAVRIGVCTVLFWLLYAARPVKMGFTKKDFMLLVFCALTGITMNQTFSMRGMSLTSPIHASLLVLATPITITLLAAWFLKESLNAYKIVGLLFGISGGVLLVFSRDLSSAAGAQQSLGDLFIIMGALSYSVYVIVIRPLMAKYKAMHILQWVFLFGAFASVPLGWQDLQNVSWSAFDGISWFSLVYLVLGATFIAYQLMNYGISKLGASIAGSFIYTQPFFATLASMIILHETLSLPKIGAAVLIMTGVFLTNYKK